MKSIKRMCVDFFFPSLEVLNRRRKRKEFKENARRQYDMPVFYATDFQNERELDIYVVAFNNAKLIEYQILLLKRFLKPNFTHIVIDNSNIKEESEKIRNICISNDVTYAKVYKPRKIRGTYSASHAMALNWAYEKFIKLRKRNFAMIDHDIFPTKHIDAADYVRDRGLFGPIRGNSIWFLWAGFAFFNWQLVCDKKLDFGPLANFYGKHIADTGSSNWKPLYKAYDKTQVPYIDYELYDLFNRKFTPKHSCTLSYEKQVETCAEYLNHREWVHLNGASGWHDIRNKNDLSFELLDGLF